MRFVAISVLFAASVFSCAAEDRAAASDPSAADAAVIPAEFPVSPVGPPQEPLRATVTWRDRWDWFADVTYSPQNLFGQTISAGWATMFNSPPEYGPHWEGFGKRYGMEMTGVLTSNLMEIGLGSLWGEDPAYHRVPERSFGRRIGYIFKMTAVAEDRHGRTIPAYARYTAYVGNNFLSNTWRADGEATNEDAIVRVGLGFLGRLSGNAWNEFWPDVKRKVFRRRSQPYGSSAGS